MLYNGKSNPQPTWGSGGVQYCTYTRWAHCTYQDPVACFLPSPFFKYSIVVLKKTNRFLSAYRVSPSIHIKKGPRKRKSWLPRMTRRDSNPWLSMSSGRETYISCRTGWRTLYPGWPERCSAPPEPVSRGTSRRWTRPTWGGGGTMSMTRILAHELKRLSMRLWTYIFFHLTGWIFSDSFEFCAGYQIWNIYKLPP
jgi:hypothetical protein